MTHDSPSKSRLVEMLYFYAVSDLAITVHRASDLGQITAQPLPGFDLEDYYW
jgi:hypothetical protein